MMTENEVIAIFTEAESGLLEIDPASETGSKAFVFAHRFTAKHEGGYTGTSGLPGDSGGETLFGIARNYNPKWRGWKAVDNVKTLGLSRSNLATALESDATLFADAAALLYTSYFLPFFTPNCYTRAMAACVYDFAVHAGPSRSYKTIQKAANKVIANEITPFALKVDGRIGPRTRKELIWIADSHDTSRAFCSAFLKKRIEYYQASSSRYKKAFIARAESLADYLDVTL